MGLARVFALKEDGVEVLGHHAVLGVGVDRVMDASKRAVVRSAAVGKKGPGGGGVRRAEAVEGRERWSSGERSLRMGIESVKQWHEADTRAGKAHAWEDAGWTEGARSQEVGIAKRRDGARQALAAYVPAC